MYILEINLLIRKNLTKTKKTKVFIKKSSLKLIQIEIYIYMNERILCTIHKSFLLINAFIECFYQ